jgi:hypothetical protein
MSELNDFARRASLICRLADEFDPPGVPLHQPIIRSYWPIIYRLVQARIFIRRFWARWINLISQ